MTERMTRWIRKELPSDIVEKVEGNIVTYEQDGEEIAYMESECGQFQRYICYADPFSGLSLSKSELYAKGEAIVRDVFHEVWPAHYELSRSAIGDEHMVTVTPIDEQTGKPLVRYEWSVGLYETGTISHVIAPSGTYSFETIDYAYSVEEVKERYIQALSLPLRYARFEGDEQYVGGDGTYHLIYDALEGMPFLEPDGTFNESYTYVTEDTSTSVDDWAQWADRAEALLHELIGPIELRTVSVTEGEERDEIRVTVERLVDGYRVGERSTLDFHRERAVMIRCVLDHGLYANITPQPIRLTREEAREIVSAYTTFGYSPEVYNDEDDQHTIFVRGISEQFPASHGAIHAVEAATGNPWLVDISWMNE